jgi:hypothetical protein
MHHHAQHVFILTTFPLFLNSFLLKISIDQSLGLALIVLHCQGPQDSLEVSHIGGQMSDSMRVSANNTLFVAKLSKLSGLEEVALRLGL